MPPQWINTYSMKEHTERCELVSNTGLELNVCRKIHVGLGNNSISYRLSAEFYRDDLIMLSFSNSSNVKQN